MAYFWKKTPYRAGTMDGRPGVQRIRIQTGSQTEQLRTAWSLDIIVELRARLADGLRPFQPSRLTN